MTQAVRPQIVLAVAPHAEARALLEREARVVECLDLTETGVVAAARDADGLLIRHKPPCTERLLAAPKP